MHKTGEDGGGWYRTLTWHPSWAREKKKAADYSVKEVIRLILGAHRLCYNIKLRLCAPMSSVALNATHHTVSWNVSRN